MKLWIDDVRPAPDGYDWAKSVDEAKEIILEAEDVVDSINHMETTLYNLPTWNNCMLRKRYTIELIDIDHDAGNYAEYGGDYIKLLDWLEETGRNYPIRIHSMNPVGRENMRAIIRKNGWTEVI